MQKARKRRKYSAFEKTVKKRLIDKGMTSIELSHLLNTTPQYLNKIFKGERSGEKYIEQIKEILNIKTVA